jgi:murein DD-endopeptidase MepM/ murein hydrolase activator NlpD
VIFGNPVRGVIYLSPGTLDGRARWFRSQRYGCTGFYAEPPLGSCKHFHRGVDIARGPAGCGDDLLSVQAGTVIYAGTLTSGGKAVVVRHASGFATGHGHLASISVSKGQKVTKGQRLGTVGDTGNATGCHDHLALKVSFPATGGVNEFWRDPGAGGQGHWADIWPLLEQNVTVRPAHEDVNIRTAPDTLPATRFAITRDDGRIHRLSDNADLGATSSERKWGGSVTGGSYSVDGATSSRWEKMWLAGRYYYVATLLARRSAAL